MFETIDRAKSPLMEYRRIASVPPLPTYLGDVIRLMIVDDHQIFRQGLQMLLSREAQLSVVAEAGNYAEAIRAAQTHKIDVVVLELSMPGRDGVELIHHLRTIRPEMKILVLSAHTEPAIVGRALRARVNGFVAKQNAVDEMVAALRHIVMGKRYVCPTVAQQIALGIIDGDETQPAHEKLSNREFKVFEMLVAGKRGNQIASELCLSAKTISTHKSHILRKLRLRDGGELLRYALRNNLTTN